jgi:hypothetical protein
MTDTTTYATTVPAYFEGKRDLVRDWATGVLENVSGFDDVSHTNINEVENESRDGFVAYTSGGFDGVGYGSPRYGVDSVPGPVKPYVERETKEHDEEWDTKNPKHPVSWVLSSAGVSWREKYHESLDARFEEGWTYFYKVRALFHNGDSFTKSESGEPEVLFCVAINTDFEYGRDSIPWLKYTGGDPECSKWAWEKTVKVADITSELIETMIEEASAALRNA